jgi:hypothetical protein
MLSRATRERQHSAQKGFESRRSRAAKRARPTGVRIPSPAYERVHTPCPTRHTSRLTTPTSSGGARLAGREACPRARARDERGSGATERIGWGGRGPTGARLPCGRLAHTTTTRIENRPGRVWRSSAWEPRGRVRHRATTTPVQNRPGRAWLKERPGVVRSCCSRCHCHSCTASAREGVAK